MCGREKVKEGKYEIERKIARDRWKIVGYSNDVGYKLNDNA